MRSASDISATPRHRVPAALRRRLTRHPREAGVALVEFALVLPVLLVLLFGMLDFGKAFNYWIDATHLANEGARWAVVNKNPGTGSLQQYIRSQANTPEFRDGGSSSVPTAVQVCVSFPNGTQNVGDPVHVEVKADYNWLPFLGNQLGPPFTTTLRGSSTMRLEARPTVYSPGCS
jgi:Flp pilus assembly protein TadG